MAQGIVAPLGVWVGQHFLKTFIERFIQPSLPTDSNFLPLSKKGEYSAHW